MTTSGTVEGSADVRWAVEASGLGRKYRRKWALRDCTFRIPAGRVCALVGPNGAGKSTLLSLAARLDRPTEGELTMFGVPAGSPAGMSRWSYLAQDKPLFKRLTVAEHLRMGRELNPGWDGAVAERIVRAGRIATDAPVGELSGGQRTRVAFALAFGKRPQLLLLDEPMADLDPVARDEMSALLMSEAAEHGTTVLMASHALAELEHMCDYLLVLADGRVRMAGGADELVAMHSLVTGLTVDGALPAALNSQVVIEVRTAGRQFTAMVLRQGALDGGWQLAEPGMEEVLLAYLRSPDAPALLSPTAVPAPAHGEERAV
ncbi:ABC transporter ATP-binding protein [Streptomyces sp. G-G2]|uniref:ABC transporter ATP-binding protein n=1 Tax=Streptomyces sp. G-G2 TaxID=3046201 RepID=UPI0024BA5128|nr:ABC transporter ATP-binding protein [Streptomyces sp. G-G2]MDJ0380073.1 ABC transporter ATP-binding protein [Streptomyces sp. G-G2]